jgi:hypothetical protein
MLNELGNRMGVFTEWLPVSARRVFWPAASRRKLGVVTPSYFHAAPPGQKAEVRIQEQENAQT